MRLKISGTDSMLVDLVETNANQTNLIIVRDKEFVGNAENRPRQTLFENDSLTVNGKELCNKKTMPVMNATIGLYVFDAGSDGRSDITQSIKSFSSVPFVNAIDLYLPTSTPETISVVFKGRQNGGLTQAINVPNWSSDTDKVSVQFRAF
jgi:hypothetical protein